MSIEPNYSQLAADIKKAKDDVESIKADLKTIQTSEKFTPELRESLQRIIMIVDGDVAADVPGLRQRVKLLEIAVGSFQEDKKQTAATLRGIAIGLGLTGVTGAGTLVTMLIQVFGGSK